MDYSTAVFNVIWAIIVIALINIFKISLNIKIGLFITFYFPLLLLSIVGFDNENILYVFYYMYKFIRNRKVYFFNKY